MYSYESEPYSEVTGIERSCGCGGYPQQYSSGSYPFVQSDGGYPSMGWQGGYPGMSGYGGDPVMGSFGGYPTYGGSGYPGYMHGQHGGFYRSDDEDSYRIRRRFPFFFGFPFSPFFPPFGFGFPFFW